MSLEEELLRDRLTASEQLLAQAKVRLSALQESLSKQPWDAEIHKAVTDQEYEVACIEKNIRDLKEKLR